ncbi:MAG: Bpu10I family restriction endonuclease [Bacteroidaceae bacterium]|nr:Bpu10I family restriction endonuclease [Bacteroidaceae bacterium]
MTYNYDYDCWEDLNFLQEECGIHTQLSHASNICTKSSKKVKAKEKRALEEVVPIYADYLENQKKLKGYSDSIIKERVKLLNEYYRDYNHLQLDDVFSSQGKFRSTILEEFMFFLFRDYVADLKRKYKDANNLIQGGAAKAYTNLYFTASGIENFVKEPNVEINVKDQDFAIYRKVELSIDGKTKEIKVPIIAVENKTYLDKTMLEGVIATAEKLKSGNPYTRFVVVSENYDVDLKVDPIYSRIDQIYVLRKTKRKEYFSPIDPDVVIRFFKETKQHIERPWSNIEAKMREEGVIM